MERKPGPARRTGLLRIAAAVVVLALLGLAGWAGVRALTDEPGAASKKDAKSSTSAPEPEPEPEQPTEEEMTSFVESYLATVTTDPAESWRRLTPKFQAKSEGGFPEYERFWSGFRTATPSAIDANPEAMTVSYSVEYVKMNGGTTRDQVTLVLEDRDGELLIAGES